MFTDLFSAIGANQDSLVVLKSGFSPISFHQKVLQLEEVKGIDFLPKILEAKTTDFDLNTHSQGIDFGHFHDKGWCKFFIKNESEEVNVILKINQSRTDLLRLFVKRNTVIDSFPAIGRTINYYERPVLSNNFVYKIPIQKGEIITCYLYSERKYGHHALVMNLMSELSFISYEGNLNFSIAMIIGMAILVIIITLALFSTVYNRVYLYYSLYTFFVLMLVLADAGYFHSYLKKPQFQFQINAATSIIFYFTIGTQLLFTVILLEISDIRQKWFYYIGRVCSALCFLLGGILLFFNQNYAVNWQVIHISYYCVFLLDAYIIGAIIVSIRRKLRIAYFYMLGFLVSIVASTVLILANIGVIDGINQNSDFFYFTPFVEIVIMVLGFGFTFSGNLQEKYIFQKKLAETQQAMISIQEDERRRIGQDLHDDVGNTLAALNTILKNRYAQDTEINEVMKQVITDVRQISHNLMPIDFEKYSLSEIIQETIRKFESKDVSIDFIEAGQSKPLDTSTSLEIYRIFNECLTNIIKHSKATNASVQIIHQENSLVMSVEDDGIGFEANNQISDGIGLKNMYSRAKFINAKLTIQSDSKGTLTILDLPINS
jgi:signal transduction histidine kinase